jgi:hypothetical protein
VFYALALMFMRFETIPSVRKLCRRLRNRPRELRFGDKYRPYSFQQIHQAGPEAIEKLFLNFLFQAFKMGIIDSSEAVMVGVDSTFMKAYSRRVGRVV